MFEMLFMRRLHLNDVAKVGSRPQDRDMRKEIATNLKQKEFWVQQRLTAKVLCPIMRSMRLCDSRLQGKAGLVWQHVRRIKESVPKRLRKACEKVMPAAQVDGVVQAVANKLEERAGEILTDHVKAATIMHPYVHLEAQKTDDMRRDMKKLRPAFFKVARAHPLWNEAKHQALEFMGQRGYWADGTKVQKCKDVTLEGFFEEVAADLECPEFKTFALDLLSYVVDSAEAERLWCLFQAADPKGSKRSRLSFSHKNKEVGIAANIMLKKYLKAQAKRKAPKSVATRRLKRKTSTDADPTMAPYEPLQAPSEDELEERDVDSDVLNATDEEGEYSADEQSGEEAGPEASESDAPEEEGQGEVDADSNAEV